MECIFPQKNSLMPINASLIPMGPQWYLNTSLLVRVNYDVIYKRHR